MKCNCGGKDNEHLIGEIGCFREHVKDIPRKISYANDKWLVDGHIITGASLRYQRMYQQHSCGNWSRPIGRISENSLSGF